MIEVRDRRIWEVAKGHEVPDEIDDSGHRRVRRGSRRNVKGPIELTTPEESLASFKLAEGYEANLFASEQRVPRPAESPARWPSTPRDASG